MKEQLIKAKSKTKMLAYLLIVLAIISSIVLGMRVLPSISFGAEDTQKLLVEAELEKYINYNTSDQDKGTLVQYNVKEKVEFGENYIPVKNSEVVVQLSQIDGKYPSKVKTITKSTELTNGKTTGIEENSTYDANTGTVTLRANNQNEQGELIYQNQPSQNAVDEYIILCYYDTYTEGNSARDLALNISAKSTLSIEDSAIIDATATFETQVTENIGTLTSIDYQAEDIYNGYIKSNKINGTDYNTQYKETEQILVSKKEAQEKIEVLENNTFVSVLQNQVGEEITTDLGNNHNLVYKSTKITKENLIKVLGEDGILEILDANQNVIATINKDTQFDDDGTITINYENDPEAIILKTSKIQDEGILLVEHTKEIKNTITDVTNTKIKTTTQITGISEEITKAEDGTEKTVEAQKYVYNHENMIGFQEAKTNVSISVSNTEWTNKQQNEVTFDISLNANTIKDNMFKNPSLRIELPSQVEKVILQNSGIFYANGLELQEPYLETNENGNIVIVANLTGAQTQYSENALELTTDVRITATIILKKDIETTQANANLIYTNQYTLDGSVETGSQALALQLESYQEEQVVTMAEESVATYNLGNTTQANVDGLKLEVAPVKGETDINNGDTVYEGEYIKYNVKVTNTTEEAMNDVTVVGSIPEGTTYGELVADYYEINGDYDYNFDANISSKEIEIGTLKAGESVTKFYEVKVNDLEEGQEEKQITTNINTYVGETQATSYSLNNVIKKAEVKIFLSANLYGSRDTWNYHIYPTSDENKEVTVTVKLPKEFEPEYLFDYSSKSETIIYDENNKPEDNIFTLKLQTNVEYYINGTMERTKLAEETEDSKITLIATASVTENNITYQSNENRVLFEYENLSISMTSSNEGEEIKYEEEINYNITIKNIGKNNIAGTYTSTYVNVTDFLPEEVKPVSITYENWEMQKEFDENNEDTYSVTGYNKLEPITETISGNTDEDGNKLPEIDLYLTIPYEESVTIEVKATAGLVYEKTKVENSATVSGDEISTKISNIITHTILPYDYEESSVNPEVPEEPTLPENPEDPETPENPGNTGTQVDSNEKYSISGVAWLDANEDGQRQTDETLLNGITTMVVNADDGTIKNQTQTTSEGTYSFSDLEAGNYVILFRYNTNTYRVTEYQKTGVSSSTNSDAVTKEVTVNGETLKAGVIEVSKLEASVTNMDIGLVENKVCDFKLDKSIEKITVTTNSGTKQYSYNNEKLAKIEIRAKEMQGATVIIEYKIVVTNEGELASTVGKIIDYLPEGLTFSSELNKNWSAGSNGQIINTSLSNQKIEAGESVELNLVATKSMTANSTGTFTNAAEIGDITNSLAIEDTDSTPGNKVATEDDYSEASVILSVSTGLIVYISIGILLAVLIGIAIFLAHKYGILKVGKTSLFGIIFAIILACSIGDSYTYTHEDKNYEVDGYAKFDWEGGYATNHKFINGTMDKFGWCDVEGAHAHGDQEGSSTNTGRYAYANVEKGKNSIKTSYYNYNKEKYEETKKPDLKLSSNNENQNIPLKLINNEYYWIGPFDFNVSNNDYLDLNNSLAYNLTVKYGSKENEKYGSEAYTICKSDGTSIDGLSGKNGQFYLKISKDNFKGIKTVILKAKASTKQQTVTEYKGYRLYFPVNENNEQDDCQVVKNATQNSNGEEVIIKTKTETTSKVISVEDSIEWTTFNGCLNIKKIDEESKPLEKVQFSIKNSSGQYVQKDDNGNISYVTTKNDDTLFETDSQGEIFIDNLTPGNYTVIEENNPNYGYTVMVEDTTQTLKSASILTITRKNEKQTGNLQIVKRDTQTGATISGISFKIKGINSDEKIRADINGDGIINVNDVTELQRYIQGTYNNNNNKIKANGLGDVNNDGTINNEDYIAIQNYIGTRSYEYIVVTDNNGKQYKGEEVTQTISLSNMTTTTNADEATIFTTDANGEIKILNMLTGEYRLEEVSVGDNWQYEADEDYITYETNGQTIRGNNIPFVITRQTSTQTSVNENSSNITYSNTVNLYNEKKYIKISGYVWQDIIDSVKSQNKDDVYDTSKGGDLLFNGITVRLKDKRTGETIKDENGNNKETKTSQLNRYTDDGNNGNGEYLFEKVLIRELENYYIEFEYDGLTYTNVTPNIDQDNGSKAKESESDRTTFNEKFSSVEGDTKTTGHTTDASGNTGYGLEYEKEGKVAILSSDGNYERKTDNSGNEFMNQESIGEYPITANTTETGYSIKEQYDQYETNNKPDEIRYINLGLWQREQPDIYLEKDLYNVKISVNNKEHIYQYASRFKNAGVYEEGFNVGVEFGEALPGGKTSYSRAVYKSDYEYNADSDKELKVYVTYQLLMGNTSTSLTAKINSITDYYDSRYSIVSIGTGLLEGNEGATNGDIAHLENGQLAGNISDSEYNNDYRKVVIQNNTEIEAEKAKSIYVQFQLSKDQVAEILHEKDEGEVAEELLDNVAEINSYSTYYDGKIYAGIDKDSNPGNIELGKTEEYEDDTAKCPALQLEVAAKRTISGTVFVDSTSEELMIGQIRQGNGIYDEGETTINGVTVTLHEINNAIGDMTTTTQSDGSFEFSNYIPGDYIITYTWGDETYTVQEYKGTVYDEERYNTNSNNKEWYKTDVETRYTDAIDNYNTEQNAQKGSRLQIDDEMANGSEITRTKMDSTTPTMGVSVEYETVVTNWDDQHTFSIKNVDFGIVERARQALEISKDVTGVKITLANGQVIVDAKIVDGELQGDSTQGVTYGPADDITKGFIRTEMDNELIQGATIQIEYTVTVANNSELDYNSEEYYKFGEVKGDIITIKPTGVYDYLDSQMTLDETQDNGNWEIISQESYIEEPTIVEKFFEEGKTTQAGEDGTITETYIWSTSQSEYQRTFTQWATEVTEEKTIRDIKLENKTILRNTDLEQEIEPRKANTVQLYTSKLLSNTDEIDLNNDVEITEVQRLQDTGRIVDVRTSYLYDQGERVTVTPPTGDDQNYLPYIILGITSFIILGVGIVIIKRKAI